MEKEEMVFKNINAGGGRGRKRMMGLLEVKVMYLV
jgi:hypothetical protein